MQAIIYVYDVLRNFIEKHSEGQKQLFMYGSTINGTMTSNSDKNSDLDLTLISKDNENEKNALSKIKTALEKN